MAVGGSVVGDRPQRQLEPLVGAGLRGVVLDRFAHPVPIDRPDALAELIQ